MKPPRRMFDIQPGAVYLLVTETAKRTGIGPVSPHDLRRTYAYLSRRGGAPIEQIQRTLGHQNLQTTERYLGGGLETEMGKAAGDYIQMGVTASD